MGCHIDAGGDCIRPWLPFVSTPNAVLGKVDGLARWFEALPGQMNSAQLFRTDRMRGRAGAVECGGGLLHLST